MYIVQLIFGVVFNMAIFAGLLLLPAGTWAWGRAWVILGGVFIATVATVVSLPLELLDERMKPLVQKGQPLADKIIVLLLVAAFCGVLVFIPLDVFRLQLLGKPGAFVSFLGLLLFIAGWGIMAFALKANTFAAPVVKHQ